MNQSSSGHKTDKKHKRVRICEECEVEECAIQCQNCEQYLCVNCNKRLHQKGARQKHKRISILSSPPLTNNCSSREMSECKTQKEFEIDNEKEKNFNNDPRNESQLSYSSYKSNFKNNQQDEDYFIPPNTTNRKYKKKYDQADSHHQIPKNSYKQFKDQKQPYYNRNNNHYYEMSHSNSSLSKQANDSGKRRYTNNNQQYQNENKSSRYSSSGNSSTGSINRGYNQKSYCNQANYQYNARDKYNSQQMQSQIKYQGYGSRNKKNFYGEQHNSQTGNTYSDKQYENKIEGIPQQYMCKEINEVLFLAENGNKNNPPILHITRRSFSKSKNLCFVSLQLEIISLEAIFWVLQSLKKDEMTPIERSIQSRIKEAFDIKLNNGALWEAIIDSMQNPQNLQDEGQQELRISQNSFNESSSNYRSVRKVNPSQFDNQDNPLHNKNNPAYKEYFSTGNYQSNQGSYFIFPTSKDLSHIGMKESSLQFIIKEVEEDPSIGQVAKAIYLKEDQQWVGVDLTMLDIDQNLYQQLKDFLQSYFCGTNLNDDEYDTSQYNSMSSTAYNQKQPQHATQIVQMGSDMEEVRAIPGGRYGCAQFVKICGPKELNECTLGKLSQLVQLAFKEDILRYHKTLVVWTTTVDKHKKMKEEMNNNAIDKHAMIEWKLEQVKNVLLEILAESKNGMSLAQVPLNLKRKLPFALDLNELGFPKLKDLVNSMSDKIKVELKSHNHPFAYLIKQNRNFHQTVNSDDFQAIPQSNPKSFIQTEQNHMSEDLSQNKFLSQKLQNNDQNIKQVTNAIYNLLREYPFGLKSNSITELISNKIGYKFNFRDYGCQSLFEFIKKFIVHTIDIEFINTDSQMKDVFTIRSKFYFHSYAQFIHQQQLNVGRKEGSQSNIQFIPDYQQQQFLQNSQQQFQNIQDLQAAFQNSIAIQQQQYFLQNQYIPHSKSLYGGSSTASVNTSMQQLNVSHLKFNTQDQSYNEQIAAQIQQQQYQQMIQQQQMLQQNPSQSQLSTINQINQQKPPLAPNQQLNQYPMKNQLNQYKTFPPPTYQGHHLQNQLQQYQNNSNQKQNEDQSNGNSMQNSSRDMSLNQSLNAFNINQNSLNQQVSPNVQGNLQNNLKNTQKIENVNISGSQGSQDFSIQSQLTSNQNTGIIGMNNYFQNPSKTIFQQNTHHQSSQSSNFNKPQTNFIPPQNLQKGMQQNSQNFNISSTGNQQMIHHQYNQSLPHIRQAQGQNQIGGKGYGNQFNQYFQGVNKQFPLYNPAYYGVQNSQLPPDSLFNSPVPRGNQQSQLFESGSIQNYMNQMNLEGSPLDQDIDEDHSDQDINIRQIERIINDDEIDNKSGSIMTTLVVNESKDLGQDVNSDNVNNLKQIHSPTLSNFALGHYKPSQYQFISNFLAYQNDDFSCKRRNKFSFDQIKGKNFQSNPQSIVDTDEEITPPQPNNTQINNVYQLQAKLQQFQLQTVQQEMLQINQYEDQKNEGKSNQRVSTVPEQKTEEDKEDIDDNHLYQKQIDKLFNSNNYQSQGNQNQQEENNLYGD